MGAFPGLAERPPDSETKVGAWPVAQVLNLCLGSDRSRGSGHPRKAKDSEEPPEGKREDTG